MEGSVQSKIDKWDERDGGWGKGAEKLLEAVGRKTANSMQIIKCNYVMCLYLWPALCRCLAL